MRTDCSAQGRQVGALILVPRRPLVRSALTLRSLAGTMATLWNGSLPLADSAHLRYTATQSEVSILLARTSSRSPFAPLRLRVANRPNNLLIRRSSASDQRHRPAQAAAAGGARGVRGSRGGRRLHIRRADGSPVTGTARPRPWRQLSCGRPTGGAPMGAPAGRNGNRTWARPGQAEWAASRSRRCLRQSCRGRCLLVCGSLRHAALRHVSGVPPSGAPTLACGPPGPSHMGAPGGPHAPPQPAIDACSQRAAGDDCSFAAPDGRSVGAGAVASRPWRRPPRLCPYPCPGRQAAWTASRGRRCVRQHAVGDACYAHARGQQHGNGPTCRPGSCRWHPRSARLRGAGRSATRATPAGRITP